VAVARDTFDMTLIDTPAAEVGADAQLVAATCGSAIVARRHASAHRRVPAGGEPARRRRHRDRRRAAGLLMIAMPPPPPAPGQPSRHASKRA
jgi:hypothetical protein